MLANDCADLYDLGYLTSEEYVVNLNIDPVGPLNIVNVYCDMTTDGGKWMVSLMYTCHL